MIDIQKVIDEALARYILKNLGGWTDHAWFYSDIAYLAQMLGEVRKQSQSAAKSEESQK